MSGFSGVVVLLGAVLGGFLGWRAGTKRIYRRSIFEEGDEGDALRRRRRRKLQRCFLAALYAVSAAAAALIIVTIFRR